MSLEDILTFSVDAHQHYACTFLKCLAANALLYVNIDTQWIFMSLSAMFETMPALQHMHSETTLST